MKNIIFLGLDKPDKDVVKTLREVAELQDGDNILFIPSGSKINQVSFLKRILTVNNGQRDASHNTFYYVGSREHELSKIVSSVSGDKIGPKEARATVIEKTYEDNDFENSSHDAISHWFHNGSKLQDNELTIDDIIGDLIDDFQLDESEEQEANPADEESDYNSKYIEQEPDDEPILPVDINSENSVEEQEEIDDKVVSPPIAIPVEDVEINNSSAEENEVDGNYRTVDEDDSDLDEPPITLSANNSTSEVSNGASESIPSIPIASLPIESQKPLDEEYEPFDEEPTFVPNLPIDNVTQDVSVPKQHTSDSLSSPPSIPYNPTPNSGLGHNKLLGANGNSFDVPEQQYESPIDRFSSVSNDNEDADSLPPIMAGDTASILDPAQNAFNRSIADIEKDERSHAVINSIESTEEDENIIDSAIRNGMSEEDVAIIREHASEFNKPYMQNLNIQDRLKQFQAQRSAEVYGIDNNDGIFTGRDGTVIAVTGTHGGAGKTTWSWVFAETIALMLQQLHPEESPNVWLIETDMQNSKLQDRASLDRSLGDVVTFIQRNQQNGGNVTKSAIKEQIKKVVFKDEKTGIFMIACPYKLDGIDTKLLQYTIKMAVEMASGLGGYVILDGHTYTSESYNSLEAEVTKGMSNKVLVVSEPQNISELSRAIQHLTKDENGKRKRMSDIAVFMNRSHPSQNATIQEQIKARICGGCSTIDDLISDRTSNDGRWVKYANDNVRNYMIRTAARAIVNMGFTEFAGIIGDEVHYVAPKRSFISKILGKLST